MQTNQHGVFPFTWLRWEMDEDALIWCYDIEFIENFGDFYKGMKFDVAEIDVTMGSLSCWNKKNFSADPIMQYFVVLPKID